jgi:hypothetical protein
VEGVHTAGGGTHISRPEGGSEFHGAHGEQARFDRAGRVREIRTSNMHIENRMGGMRHVEVGSTEERLNTMVGASPISFGARTLVRTWGTPAECLLRRGCCEGAGVVVQLPGF